MVGLRETNAITTRSLDRKLYHLKKTEPCLRFLEIRIIFMSITNMVTAIPKNKVDSNYFTFIYKLITGYLIITIAYHRSSSIM